MHLVQLVHPRGERRVAIVTDSQLALLRGYRTIYALATEAIRRETRIAEVAGEDKGSEVLDYDSPMPMWQSE